MVKIGEYFKVKDMSERGMNIMQIADELGRDRKTVRKWLQAGEPGVYSQRKPVAGKLDAYKDYIRNRMAEGCLNARVILEEIRLKSYTRRQHHPSDFHAAAP